MINKSSLFFFILIILSSCNKSNLKDYYFNYNDLKNPKTYKFVNQNDTNDVVFWKMQYKIINNDTNLITLGLNKQKKITEETIEKVSQNGAYLLTYSMIEYDSTGKRIIESKIINDELYSFNKKVPINWTVSYTNKYGPEIFSKTRTLVSINKAITLQNKKYNCAKFRDDYLIRYDDEKIYEFYQESYYAKGLGIIRYERFFPDNKTYDFQLTDIIPN